MASYRKKGKKQYEIKRRGRSKPSPSLKRSRRFIPKVPDSEVQEGRRPRTPRMEVKLWLEDSDDSLKVARDNLAQRNYHVAALYIHQAVEKALKAAVIAFKHEMPPKIHVLDELYEEVSDEVPLTDEQRDFLVELTPTYQVARYVNAAGRLPRDAYTKRLVERYLKNAIPIIEAVKKSMTSSHVAKESNPIFEEICGYVSEVDAELGVEKAFIFGSTAKGNRLKGSDVDLIIVSNAFRKMSLPGRLHLLRKIWRHSKKLRSLELQSLAYTPEEFEEASQTLMMKEILSYAVEIVPASE